MSKKKTNSGRGRIIFLGILLLLAVIAVLFWKGAHKDYSVLAVRINDSLSGVMKKSGIGDKTTVDAASSEKKSRFSVWKEYYRKVQLPESVNMAKLLADIESQARQYRLKVNRSEEQGKVVVTLCRGDRVFSRLVLVPPQKTEKLALKKRFALVIDDIGSKRDLSGFTALNIPITFAIMPHERHSKDIAGDLAARQMPYILHLPLEPLAYPKVDPGSAALLIKMSDEQLRQKFAADLQTVPGAVGISNHMGSRFSEDEGKMKLLLGMVKERGLFYFDSYTTPKTKAPRVARELRARFRENDLFVDLEDTPEFMRKQFDHILRRFERVDEFIAIGHIQKKSLLPVLQEYVLKFKEAGIEFVYLSDLMGDAAKR